MTTLGADVFRIEFNTANAAFDGDDMRPEILRILTGICRQIDSGADHGIIIDGNGNRIGSWTMPA